MHFDEHKPCLHYTKPGVVVRVFLTVASNLEAAPITLSSTKI